MELLILTIILLGLGVLSLRFGYDSRSVAYAKEHQLANLGMLWDVEVLRLVDLRRDAEHWRMQRRASGPPGHALRRMRRGVADGLRALAWRLNPELLPPQRLDISPPRVAGC